MNIDLNLVILCILFGYVNEGTQGSNKGWTTLFYT